MHTCRSSRECPCIRVSCNAVAPNGGLSRLWQRRGLVEGGGGGGRPQLGCQRVGVLCRFCYCSRQRHLPSTTSCHQCVTKAPISSSCAKSEAAQLRTACATLAVHAARPAAAIKLHFRHKPARMQTFQERHLCLGGVSRTVVKVGSRIRWRGGHRCGDLWRQVPRRPRRQCLAVRTPRDKQRLHDTAHQLV